ARGEEPLGGGAAVEQLIDDLGGTQDSGVLAIPIVIGQAAGRIGDIAQSSGRLLSRLIGERLELTDAVSQLRPGSELRQQEIEGGQVPLVIDHVERSE